MTKGEYRVTSSNPSEHPDVKQITKTIAGLIDHLESIVDTGEEAGRCAAIAQTKFEEAAMWAVKAITKPERF